MVVFIDPFLDDHHFFPDPVVQTGGEGTFNPKRVLNRNMFNRFVQGQSEAYVCQMKLFR